MYEIEKEKAKEYLLKMLKERAWYYNLSENNMIITILYFLSGYCPSMAIDDAITIADIIISEVI